MRILTNIISDILSSTYLTAHDLIVAEKQPTINSPEICRRISLYSISDAIRKKRDFHERRYTVSIIVYAQMALSEIAFCRVEVH